MAQHQRVDIKGQGPPIRPGLQHASDLGRQVDDGRCVRWERDMGRGSDVDGDDSECLVFFGEGG